MAWLSVCVLVAAVLVPLILLRGFAGCSPTLVESFPPSAPTNVSVVEVGRDTLTLTWLNHNLSEVTYEVERTTEGATIPERLLVSELTDPNTAEVRFVDTNLTPSTFYSYQVRAVRPVDEKSSLQSQPPASATTLP